MIEHLHFFLTLKTTQKMKIKQLIALLFLFASPLLLLSQEKVSSGKNGDPFFFETLNEKQNGSADFKLNYEKGMEHYNAGVNIIKRSTSDVTLEELSAIEIKSKEQFELARPYLLRANSLDPTDKNSIAGLAGIYYGLNDHEKCEKYKKELNQLNKK